MNPPKKIYVTNKELLIEINKSKMTYCSFIDPQYTHYDVIVSSVTEITPDLIEELRVRKSRPRGKDHIPLGSIPPESIVVRVMTYEHIPLDPHRVRKSRVTDQSYAWTKFIPFKHYILTQNGPEEVLRSHWVGGFNNGYFAPDEGVISPRLARMFMLLVTRLASKSNWRGYSYREDMEGQALVQLCQVGLQFNEAKSDNPFAFYTTTVNNIFTRTLNLEKRVQNVRDDILETNGRTPSGTRQLQNEMVYQKGLDTNPPLAKLPRLKAPSKDKP